MPTDHAAIAVNDAAKPWNERPPSSPPQPRASFGVLLFTGRYKGMAAGEGLRAAIDCAVAAERAGWDEAWVTEHHFNPHLESSSAITLAAFLLGHTRKLRVGTAASILSVWHPVALAEQANMLDIASGGRFSLGVARGMPTLDFEVLGDGAARGERGFDEALDLLLKAVAGPSVAAQGEFFRFPAVQVVPSAKTEPHPPIVVAANSPRTAAAAAARGLPLMLAPVFPDEQKLALLEHYNREAERHGHDPSAVEHYNAAVVHVAASRERALAELDATWVEWFLAVQRGAPLLKAPEAPFSRAAFEQMAAIQPVGTTEQCEEALAASVERTGLRRTMLIVDATGRPEQTLENVGALAPALERLR